MPVASVISRLALCLSVSVLSLLMSFASVLAIHRTQNFSTFTASQTPKRQHEQNVKQRRAKKSRPDVIFVPTPPETVNEMLRLAEITPGDVLYDLGSGDGRIPIQAARLYGIRAVGIDIDPKLIALAEERARQAGVADRVRFLQADLFRTDISEATIVTLYLSDRLNLLLRPKLLRELRPGTRIISHDFRMGDWKPERSVRVNWRNLYRTIYVWTIPAHGRVQGRKNNRGVLHQPR